MVVQNKVVAEVIERHSRCIYPRGADPLTSVLILLRASVSTYETKFALLIRIINLLSLDFAVSIITSSKYLFFVSFEK
jgi:hypothetical protein